MTAAPLIRPLAALPPGLGALRGEAAMEGFRFMDRLVREWEARTNRFDRAGEVLLGACAAGELLAVCGLNIDPYAGGADTGRLRHLYVRPAARRRGIGSALVRQALERAEGVFQAVRLRTETREAAAFYARHGFLAVEEERALHRKELRPIQPPARLPRSWSGSRPLRLTPVPLVFCFFEHLYPIR